MINPIPIIYKDKIIGYSIGGDAYPINEITLTFGSLKSQDAKYVPLAAIIDCGIPKHSGRYPQNGRKLTIKNVIFNDPATIVFWNDGTKTVVKTQNGEVFDPEKGLAMAICKKMIGKNTGRYYETFKKWLPNANKDSLEDVNKDSLEDLTPFEKWLSNPCSVDLTSMLPSSIFMAPPEEGKDEKDN